MHAGCRSQDSPLAHPVLLVCTDGSVGCRETFCRADGPRPPAVLDARGIHASLHARRPPVGRSAIVRAQGRPPAHAPSSMSDASMTVSATARFRQALRRLRAQLWPILETVGAALVAWYLAKLLLSERETGFAPIAAVICLGATLGQQRERALELTGGVVLGVLVADLLVRLIGNGPLQVALMMVLAMSAAVLVGGGSLLMVEASVSAIIIGSAAPSSLGLFPTRLIEALLGGGVAFAVHSLVFPPDPVLLVGRAANAVFG